MDLPSDEIKQCLHFVLCLQEGNADSDSESFDESVSKK